MSPLIHTPSACAIGAYRPQAFRDICKLMQKLTVYKNANISVGGKNLTIGGVPYPLDDVLYAEVLDDKGKVSEAFMSPHDLFVDRLLSECLSLSFMFLVILVCIWNANWFGLTYLVFFPGRALLNWLRKRIVNANSGTSYVLFVHFRNGSVPAYTTNVLFYPQMISHRINNTVRQRMLNTEPLSLTNHH